MEDKLWKWDVLLVLLGGELRASLNFHSQRVSWIQDKVGRESMGKKISRVGLLNGLFLLLLIGGLFLLPLLAEELEESVRIKILEWRLPAEIEYLMLQNEFLDRRQALEKQFENQPTLLNTKRKELTKEEQRQLQHVMDLHGFDETVFWSFQSEKGDKDLKKKIMEKDPEVFRRSTIHRLRSLLESGRQTLKTLEANNAETVEVVRQEISQYEIKLRSLEQEEVKWRFPRAKNELETFSSVQIEWWELKHEFVKRYDALSNTSRSYFRDRWDLVQWYRAKLREVVRSSRIQLLHYNAYQIHHPRFLQAYIQQHPLKKQRLQVVQESLKTSDRSLSISEAPGMGMIVGSVIECSIPPVRCRGEDKEAGSSVAQINIKLRLESGDSSKTNEFRFDGKSNDQGQFIFLAVPPGDYTLYPDLLQTDPNLHYRGPARKFFVSGNEEVLILDLLVEKVKVRTQPVPVEKRP